MDDAEITAELLHYSIKGIEVPYIRGQVADCKFNAQQAEAQILVADGKGVEIIVFTKVGLKIRSRL